MLPTGPVALRRDGGQRTRGARFVLWLPHGLGSSTTQLCYSTRTRIQLCWSIWYDFWWLLITFVACHLRFLVSVKLQDEDLNGLNLAEKDASWKWNNKLLDDLLFEFLCFLPYFLATCWLETASDLPRPGSLASPMVRTPEEIMTYEVKFMLRRRLRIFWQGHGWITFPHFASSCIYILNFTKLSILSEGGDRPPW